MTLKKISENFSIRFDLKKTPLHLTEWQAGEISRIWTEKQQTQLLFDGLLFSVLSVHHESLFGHWVDYRYMIAQRYSPALKPLLNVIPLGISAITLCQDHVLIGKRAAHLANYPNCYECAPSGGVDPSTAIGCEVDVKALIINELEEEVHVSAEDIKTIKLSYLYHDAIANSYELVTYIHLHPHALENIAPSEEYPEVFWIHKTEINSFLNLHKDVILPLTQELLRNLLQN